MALANAEPDREGLARWLSRTWHVVVKQRIMVAVKEIPETLSVAPLQPVLQAELKHFIEMLFTIFCS